MPRAGVKKGACTGEHMRLRFRIRREAPLRYRGNR